MMPDSWVWAVLSYGVHHDSDWMVMGHDGWFVMWKRGLDVCGHVWLERFT